MKTSLVKDPDNIKIAMLGMVEGNGHPYSWSAIINGYDPDEMARCPYYLITDYLDKEPAENINIAGVEVSHVWTDNYEDAQSVSKASLVRNVVSKPEDVIGEVDAVIIATDIGHEHIARARPFIESGLPVFIDKPLVDNEKDLEIFKSWKAEGKPILSSSSMRYSKEFAPYRESVAEFGELRFISLTMPKTWERYGIHVLEAIYPILGTGFISCRNTGTVNRDVVHIKHKKNVDIIAVVINDLYGADCALRLCGTAGHVEVTHRDHFYSFKQQLDSFITYLRTGVEPFPFIETEELMKMVIAGIRSREEKGREVMLSEIISKN